MRLSYAYRQWKKQAKELNRRTSKSLKIVDVEETVEENKVTDLFKSFIEILVKKEIKYIIDDNGIISLDFTSSNGVKYYAKYYFDEDGHFVNKMSKVFCVYTESPVSIIDRFEDVASVYELKEDMLENLLDLDYLNNNKVYIPLDELAVDRFVDISTFITIEDYEDALPTLIDMDNKGIFTEAELIYCKQLRFGCVDFLDSKNFILESGTISGIIDRTTSSLDDSIRIKVEQGKYTIE